MHSLGDGLFRFGQEVLGFDPNRGNLTDDLNFIGGPGSRRATVTSKPGQIVNGKPHVGMDMEVGLLGKGGDKVFNPFPNARVVKAGWDSTGYGNMVKVALPNDYYAIFGHLQKISVTVGQTLKRGDLIGLEGSTGNSSAPHLHLEIRDGPNLSGGITDPKAFSEAYSLLSAPGNDRTGNPINTRSNAAATPTGSSGRGAITSPDQDPAFARGLNEIGERTGIRPADLARMTRTEQLKYVEKYFVMKQDFRNNKYDGLSIGQAIGKAGGGIKETYLGVFAPAFVGSSQDTTIYSGATAKRQAKDFDVNKDGSIQKWELAQALQERAKQSGVDSYSSNGMIRVLVDVSGNVTVNGKPGPGDAKPKFKRVVSKSRKALQRTPQPYRTTIKARDERPCLEH